MKENEIMNVQSVCVIGAGISGLCVVKELKEKHFKVKCFEASNSIGGALKKENVYDSLLLTVSNYFMAYSSFPPAVHEGRRYWTAYEFIEYLTEYTKHFGIQENIELNTKTVSVEKIAEHFKVTIEQNGKQRSELFDAVVICTGTNRIPYQPKLPGLDRFGGETLHTSDYKSNKKHYEGKTVVCIGIGESGADICHEITQSAKSCTLLVRNMPSIVPRYINQHTNDAFTTRAFDHLGQPEHNLLALELGVIEKRKLADSHGQVAEDLDWIFPTKTYFNRFLTKNDVFVKDIATGELKLKESTIVEVTEDTIIFADGSKMIADVIVLNTGYSECFEIIEDIVDVTNIRDLYKHMIDPQIGPTLALIGWARPTQGGVPACSEMQARYLAMILAGEKQLPQGVQLTELIEKDRQWEENFFDQSKHIKGLVCYHQFMKSLAALIGCEPQINPYIHPKLAYKGWYGSHLACLYRLNGPAAEYEQSKKVICSLPVAGSTKRNVVYTLIALGFPIPLVASLSFKWYQISKYFRSLLSK
jgi:dimethylaniline monooxygenase (N-oxide forming)